MTIIQEGGEFKCSICGFSTPHRFNLKPHFEAFHLKKYSCNRCSFVSTKYGMICHYETIHRFVIPNYGKGNIRPYCTPVAEYSEIEGLSDFADGGTADAVVDDSLATESRNFAASMVETIMDSPSTAVFDGSEGGPVEITIEGGKCKCSICGFSSIYRGNMRAHVEALHQKKFSCNRCSIIKTKYDMIQHYETAHDVIIPHLGKGSRDVYYKAVGEVPGGHSSAFADGGHWINELNAEEVTIIQEGDEFMCSICGYAAPKGSVKAHIAVLHKKKYSCNCCSVVLTKYDMINHYKTDHNTVISSKGHSLKYFKEVDKDPEAQDSSFLAENSPDDSMMGDTCRAESKHPDEGSAIIKEGDIFKCSKCTYSSDKKENARLHLESHHIKMYSCNQCSAVMTRYQMVKHYGTDHGVIIANRGLSEGNVGHYFEAFNQAPEVAENLGPEQSPEMEHSASKTPTGDDFEFMFKDGKEYRCPVCNHSSRAKPLLQKHFASLHKKKFSCNRCSVVMTKYDMIQHFKIDHGIKIPYNGRGLLTHYFKVVNQDSDVAGLSDADPAAEAASPAAIENHSDLSVAVNCQKDLKCTECDFSAKCVEDLETHRETLHGLQRVRSRSLDPADCEKTCSVESGLSTHSSATNKVADGSCSSNDVADRSSLDSVTRGCIMFKCPLCNFSSRLRMHLQVHTKTMHSSKRTCRLCSMVMSEHELHSHYRNVHSTTNPDCEVGKQFNQDAVSDPKGVTQERISVEQPGPSRDLDVGLSDCQNQYKCAKCEFSTDVEDCLTSHIEALHYKKYHCNHCTAIMTKHELMSHSKNLHGVNFHVRSYVFREVRADLDNSKDYDDVSDADAVGARRTFSCPTCDFSTKAKWYLKDHIGKFHIGKYRCPHCSVLMTRYDLTKHCKNIHHITYSLRQFLKLCPSTISGPSEEISVESGEVVFENVKRTSENFPTSDKVSLNEHMENICRKKFSCRQCSAVMTKSELRKHAMEMHGIRSKIDKRFFDVPKAGENQAKSRYKKSEFKKPKRFPCQSCPFSSFHPYGLKRHVKLHHTVKYPCQHCVAVMTRYDLIKHCRNVHNSYISGNPPDMLKSEVNVHSSEATTQPTGEGVHFSMQTSTSQDVHPKYQTQLPTAPTNTVQSPTVQPFVVLEKLPIDVDELESTFSVIGTKATDSRMLENPKFPSKPF